MILVLRPGATAAEAAEVLQELAKRGCAGNVVQAGASSVVHVTHGRARRVRKLRHLEQILEIVPTSGPRVRREGWRFFPYHFVNWSAAGVALLGVLVFLAGLMPTGIGAEVDYSHPPASVSQPWYLRPAFAFVGLFPGALEWLGWLVLWLLALAFLALPLLERSLPAGGASRSLRFAAALALCAYAVLAIAGGVRA